MRAVSCSERWLNRFRERYESVSTHGGFGRLCVFFQFFVGFDRFVGVVLNLQDPGTELERFGLSEMSEIPVPTWKYPDQGSKWEVSKLFRPIYQINPILILTQGSETRKLFDPNYYIKPILI